MANDTEDPVSLHVNLRPGEAISLLVGGADTARVWKVAAVRKGTPAWGAWPAEAVAADRLASVMAASVGMGIHARMHADKPMVAAAYAAAEAACRLAFMADAAQEEGDVA